MFSSGSEMYSANAPSLLYIPRTVLSWQCLSSPERHDAHFLHPAFISPTILFPTRSLLRESSTIPTNSCPRTPEYDMYPFSISRSVPQIPDIVTFTIVSPGFGFG